MKPLGRPLKPHADAAAQGDTWRPSFGFIALAAAIAAGGITYLVMAPDTERQVVTLAAQVPQSTNMANAVSPTPSAPAPPTTSGLWMQSASSAPAGMEREVNGDPTPDLSNYVNPGDSPTMQEVITRLQQNGVETGLAAFSPPGTRPPMVGLAVPEDFALPPGYVRHHQATDDGQRIEAILMFAPDLGFIDTPKGRVAVPKDRLVTPELAPEGLTLRRVAIPAPLPQPGPRP